MWKKNNQFINIQLWVSESYDDIPLSMSLDCWPHNTKDKWFILLSLHCSPHTTSISLLTALRCNTAEHSRINKWSCGVRFSTFIQLCKDVKKRAVFFLIEWIMILMIMEVVMKKGFFEEEKEQRESWGEKKWESDYRAWVCVVKSFGVNCFYWTFNNFSSS